MVEGDNVVFEKESETLTFSSWGVDLIITANSTVLIMMPAFVTCTRSKMMKSWTEGWLITTSQ